MWLDETEGRLHLKILEEQGAKAAAEAPEMGGKPAAPTGCRDEDGVVPHSIMGQRLDIVAGAKIRWRLCGGKRGSMDFQVIKPHPLTYPWQRCGPPR